MQVVADGCTGGLDGVRTCVGDLLQLHCHTLGSPPTSLSFHLTLSPTLLFLLFSLSHFLCVAPRASVAILSGWFADRKSPATM